MKFPETIKVGAIIYKVIIATENERWHEYDDEFGHVDHATREIKISTKHANDQKRDTLVHEIVHAIFRHMNLDWGDKSEDYTKRVSNGLNMVLRDNPKFVKLLGQK